MQTDSLDLDKLIKVNSLQEIKNPRILTSSLSYQSDGLLSNDIFGYSAKERQTTFAYIDLHGHYIHPLIYKEIIMRSMRILVRVIEGTETVKVVDGKVVPDPDGWTGIESLYQHWNEIKVFGPTPRSIGNMILPYLSRKDVFIDKMIVIPPFYHDADVNTKTKKVKVSELTSMYSKLITDVQFKINTVTSFDIVSNASVVKIQNQLVLIHLYLSQQLAKKTGYIRRRLLSKKTDFGIRSVLTAPSYTGKDIDLDSIRYDRLYIPVAQVTGGAYPFILRFIKMFFENVDDKIEYDVPHGDKKDWQVYQPEIQFDLQYIETLVSNFNKFAEKRFDPLTVEIVNINTKERARVVMKERIEYEGQSPTLHPISSTDICYRAAYDSCYDRYAQFSRYPVLNVYGIFFAKIDVLSTNETVHVKVQGSEYKTYPKISAVPKEKMASQFITTCKFSLSRLGGMTGDFDGDTGPIKILYSDEAIAEAKKISESKMDKIDILGTLSKQVENEIGQGVTVLTRKV